jgi:ribose 5-phosphate isomerase B
MKIVLGGDHGGWKMKEELKVWLREERHEVIDVGALKENLDDDYVDFAILVAEELKKDEEAWGVLFCRNGFGMVIAANRYKNVRCGFGFDEKAVARGRNDDDINCLAIPADYVSLDQVKEIIKAFLETKFSGEERYQNRLEKLNLIK